MVVMSLVVSLVRLPMKVEKSGGGVVVLVYAERTANGDEGDAAAGGDLAAGPWLVVTVASVVARVHRGTGCREGAGRVQVEDGGGVEEMYGRSEQGQPRRMMTISS